MPHSQEIDANDVLQVRGLNVTFSQQQQAFSAVRDLSFTLRRGETLAIVGESGSGKSVTSLALMRLLDRAVSEVRSDALLLRRRNRQVIELSEQSDADMRGVRGADMAMIFQEPMTSLNPVFTIGEQIAESIRLHQGLKHDEALREAKKMLDQVRIPEAEAMLSRFPHQLSGGMRQRVMIAMALSCRPAVLIADEPTTALDVTIQAQILQLIAVLQKEMAMGVIFITHDMGVVADIADRVLVMYRGEAVETGSVEEIFRAPQHPYTQALLAAVPRLGAMRGTSLPRRFPLLNQSPSPEEQNTVVAGEPILKVRDLVARFPLRSGILNRITREVHAVEKVSFDLWPGETLSLVGESGCGKSTTARLLMQLLKQDSGELIFDGLEVGSSRLPMKAYRRQVQMVFQDSYASLNPRMTMEESIAFGQRVHGVSAKEASEYARYLLAHVGLEPERFAHRYPHALSGGQRQRVNIARALAMKPRLVILDEAVSALDKSVEAQVLQLLQELKRTLALTYVFISHDLHVVRWLSDRILVMYLGEVVEIGPAEQLFTASAHPYTRALLSSMPSMDPHNRTLTSALNGDPPSPISPPSGCRFHTRCPHARAVCAEVKPTLQSVGEGHQSACLMAQPASPWHQNIAIQEVSHVA